eukprot:4721959-Pyramimonas_sp.AAC.1
MVPPGASCRILREGGFMKTAGSSTAGDEHSGYTGSANYTLISISSSRIIIISITSSASSSSSS